MMKSNLFKTLFVAGLCLSGTSAFAQSCDELPDHAALTAALKLSTAATSKVENGGLGFNMWGTLINRDGEVCAVTMTGDDRGDQWPISRAISAQKANTANAGSLPGFALSTANLYAATQPGGSLFGIAFSNPIDTQVVYGNAEAYGTVRDPMVGKKPGGVSVFGGGLALYNNQGKLIGGLGVSGNTSCADHNVAWRTRKALNLDKVPAGVNPNGDDGIIYDMTDGVSASGYGHPECGGTEPDVARKIGAGQ